MTRLLARSAENLFWLARYVERAENLARILDVQETFARDHGASQDWRLVLVINADAEEFFKRHSEADSASVLRFYVIDRTNPTSIFFNVHAARENARALRPLISTEMWTQLNMLYNRVLALKPTDVAEEKLSTLCDWIKRGCDAHTGITAGTFYRDEGWCFYQLGAAIECADQTTRLLDVKFLNFMAQADQDPGSATDSFYWMALLRSAAGYQAFRRRHPRGMVPEQVAAFLLSDPCFPRSVACCLGVIGEQLNALRRQYNLRATATPCSSWTRSATISRCARSSRPSPTASCTASTTSCSAASASSPRGSPRASSARRRWGLPEPLDGSGGVVRLAWARQLMGGSLLGERVDRIGRRPPSQSDHRQKYWALSNPGGAERPVALTALTEGAPSCAMPVSSTTTPRRFSAEAPRPKRSSPSARPMTTN